MYLKRQTTHINQFSWHVFSRTFWPFSYRLKLCWGTKSIVTPTFCILNFFLFWRGNKTKNSHRSVVLVEKSFYSINRTWNADSHTWNASLMKFKILFSIVLNAWVRVLSSPPTLLNSTSTHKWHTFLFSSYIHSFFQDDISVDDPI